VNAGMFFQERLHLSGFVGGQVVEDHVDFLLRFTDGPIGQTFRQHEDQPCPKNIAGGQRARLVIYSSSARSSPVNVIFSALKGIPHQIPDLC
jgi:hypothetical protein